MHATLRLPAVYWQQVAKHYDRKGEQDLNYLAALDKRIVHHHSGLFEPGRVMSRESLGGASEAEILAMIGESEDRLASLGFEVLVRYGARGPGLDCGCGRGGSSLAFGLRDERLEMEGITISESQLAFARRAAEELGLAERISYSYTNVFDLTEAAPHRYGFIYACESTEYMEPRSALFEIWVRLLRPEGIALLFVYSTVEGHPRLSRDDLDFINDHYVMRMGSLQEYLRESAAAGFALADLVDLKHEVIPYWVLRTLSANRSVIEEPVLRGLRSGALKYSLMVLRAPAP